MRNGLDLERVRKAAIEAAVAAGEVLTKNFGKKLTVSKKKGAGLVTQVDFASENAALKVLKKRFPDFGILTEESGEHSGTEIRCPGRWILDPLDGTTNYVHGFPMFCVSLAAEWMGEVVVGVIVHPILEDVYVATRGKGATLNNKKIRVSKTSGLSNSLLTTGFTYRKDEWLHREMEAFERLSGVARAIRRPGSAALDLAYTARGVFDGFWERRLSPWDIAAGGLLVQEAGGKVTDFKGNSFSVDSPEILASNRVLHPSLLQTVAPEFCPI
ncbi:MAG: inositol monophosphatase family protein [Bdellovibrionota bacterium]